MDAASVQFPCPTCGSTLTVPLTSLGIKGPCPNCGGEIDTSVLLQPSPPEVAAPNHDFSQLYAIQNMPAAPVGMTQEYYEDEPEVPASDNRLKNRRSALGLPTLVPKGQRSGRSAEAAFGTVDHRKGGRIIAIGAVLLVGAAIAGVVAMKPWKKKAAIEAAAPLPASWKGPEAKEIAEGFAKAKNHQERLHWVRFPDKHGAAMETFFTTGPGSMDEIENVEAVEENMISVFELGQEVSRYAVKTKDGKRRLLSIVATEDGGKIDFLSYSRHTSVPWPEILNGKTPGAEVRVFLSKGQYYLGDFADSDKWQCYSLSSPDLEHNLTAYTEKTGVDFASLQLALQRPSARVTLKISPIGDSWNKRQFRIDQFIKEGWTE